MNYIRKDSDLSIWLSVDPLSDKTPYVSPFAYCINNPVRLIDPDGRDWFENELTGAIYFNSKMGKNDAGKGAMTGEGWKHLGANGMFADGKEIYSKNSDFSLVAKNGGDISFDKNTNSINIELSLEGRKAESFMSGLDYDKKPLIADVYSKEKRSSLPEPNGPMWLCDYSERIEKVYSWTYTKCNGSYSILGYYGKKTQDLISVKEMNWTRETWERRIYDYSKPSNSIGPMGSDAIQLLKYTWDIVDFFNSKNKK